ncbi:MAG: hypothetical protein QNJ94_18665 [Alphaproteobacteria bacterium]|nr:hypothetical protein [Alphaproteobacteria bacterium]
MARRKDTDDNVTSLPNSTDGKIKDAFREVHGLREQIKGLQAQVREKKAGLEGEGITKRAFEEVYRKWRTLEDNEDGRDKVVAHDEAIAACEEALGLDSQLNLFDQEAPAAAE